jgi:hypothetical protein
MGKTPYTGHVKPGKHTIWVERYGYLVGKLDIEVQPGTAATHMINLEKVANGWISVVGKQSKGGKLMVDGKPGCETPCRQETPPGKHKIVVAKEGFEDYKSDLEVGRSAETEVQVAFSARPSRSSAWSTAVMSALFLSGGVYAGLKGKSLDDALAKEIKRGDFVDTRDPRADRGKYWYIGADVLFGLGGLMGAIAAYNFLSHGPDSTGDVETKAIGFAPTGDARGGAFFARGRF